MQAISDEIEMVKMNNGHVLVSKIYLFQTKPPTLETEVPVGVR